MKDDGQIGMAAFVKGLRVYKVYTGASPFGGGALAGQ